MRSVGEFLSFVYAFIVDYWRRLRSVSPSPSVLCDLSTSCINDWADSLRGCRMWVVFHAFRVSNLNGLLILAGYSVFKTQNNDHIALCGMRSLGGSYFPKSSL